MLGLAREISELGVIPRGYAVAYWRPWSQCAVCYPIGLHWLVSVARSLYTFIQHARCREGWETLWRVRFERGRETGYRAGYEAGIRHANIARTYLDRAQGHATATAAGEATQRLSIESPYD